MNKLNELMAEVMGLHRWSPCYDKSGLSDVYLDEQDKRVCSVADWHPDTDMSQAMMCAIKFYDISGDRVVIDGKTVWISDNLHKKYLFKEVSQAICEAIAEAVKK